MMFLGNAMKRISIKEASKRLGVAEQGVRMMVQLEKIPGAFCYGSKNRRTYFITDEQVDKIMKGESHK